MIKFAARPVLTRSLVVTGIALLARVSLAQEASGDAGEIDRLRAENRELRRRMARLEQELKAGRPKTAVSKAAAVTSDSTETSRANLETEFVPDPEPSPPRVLTALDKVVFRKSVFSEEVLAPAAISAPAQLTYVHSGSGENSYAIDAGLAMTFATPVVGLMQFDWGMGVDYHRNSSSSSPKNLFQAGVVIDGAIGNPALSDFFARVKAHASYKDNEEKDTETFAGGIDVLPVLTPLGIDSYHRLGPAHWRWQPFVGLRGEVGNGPAGKSAGRLVARYGAEAQVFPLFDYVKRTLEADFRLIGWSVLHHSGPYNGDDWNGYLDAELTYWFNGGLEVNKQKVNLGFGLTYERGDNVDLDEADIDLLSVSLKAKF